MGQNERNKFYYDMLDEAEKIDSVVHDLIGTLNEEDLDKGIFVGKKENGEHVEQEFHLVAKDMKKTVVDLLGSANENEIVVGGPDETITGSNVYLERDKNNDITENFNAKQVIFDLEDSYVKVNPVVFEYSYKTIQDEEGNEVEPETRSSLSVNPGVFTAQGGSTESGSFFYTLLNPGSYFLSGQNSNPESSFEERITSSGIVVKANENKRVEIDDTHVYLHSGNANFYAPMSNTIDLRSNSKIFMSKNSYPTKYNETSADGLTNNPYGFSLFNSPPGPQLMLDGNGSCFIRNQSFLYMDKNVTAPTYNVITPAGGQIAQSTSYGPIIVAYGSPFFCVGDTAIVNFRQNARVYIDGNSRFTMHGKAIVDITGTETSSVIPSTQFVPSSISTTPVSPQIYIHDKVFISMDSGDEGHNPNIEGPRINIHGNVKLDMDSGLNDNNPKGPEIYIHNDPHIYIDGEKGQGSPEIYIHDKVKIHLDNGIGMSSPYDGASRSSYNSGGVFLSVRDKATVDITKGAWLKMSDTALIQAEGHSTIGMKDNAFLEMQNGAMLEIKDDSGLMLEEGSIFHMATKKDKKPPRAFMCGPSYFCMQTYDTQEKGPLFVVEDKALYYLGDGYVPSDSNTSMDGRWRGATGWGELISDRLNSNSLTTVKDYWGEDVLVYNFGNVKGTSNKLIPCVKIGGNITLNLDTSNPNGVYIKVGNPANSQYDDYRINVFLEGDTFIRTGEHNKIDLNGGWFQTTGNPHTEIHNNTRFIFRGNLTEPVPWLDGLKFETVKKGTNGETYEWESFNSSRHVKPADSPVAQMYDSSNFCMRGVWKVPEEFEKTVTLTITQDDHSQIYDELKDKTGPIETNEIHPKLDGDLKTVYGKKPYDSSDTRGFCIENEDGTKEYVPNSFMEEISSVKSIGSVTKDEKGNIILKEVKISVKPKKPANWNEKAVKIPNNPLLEVIENAEVRIRGNVYIDISDEGISIGKVGEANQETELFKFTVEDIKTVYDAVKSGNLSTEAKPMVYQVKENINVAGDSYVDTVVENVKTAESIVCQIPPEGFTELNDEWFEKHTVEMPETTSETSSDS